jgi:hypothetical protein
MPQFRHYSDTYPPANRPESPWPYEAIDITLLSAAGLQLFNMITLSRAATEGELEKLVPLDTVKSDISDERAVTLGFPQIVLSLSPAEATRLVRGTLEPEEFFALAEKYGIFYLISYHYYDEETGSSYEIQGQHEEEMTRLMSDGVLVVSPLDDGRVRVAFEEGPVMHEGLNADANELRSLLLNLGYNVAKPATPCWSCEKPVTEEERAENDGFCPHCMAELSVED